MKTRILLIILITLFNLAGTRQAYCQIEQNGSPVFGGMLILGKASLEDIDEIFLQMKENGCNICRIYVGKPRSGVDYPMLDHAFRAAERNGIMILATLGPDYPFPKTRDRLEDVSKYIEETVNHFKQFESLYAWGIMNEPATRGMFLDRDLDKEMFEEWKEKNSSSEFFDKENFLLSYHSWYLNWISDEIRKHDPDAHLRLNPLNLFERAEEYDFPRWREFLSSLGASVHASWHFGWFERERYAVAMSAQCEMIRSGAGDLPWVITELQGGPNIFCGHQAMCPTPDEISQWLWVNIGSGSKGGIFFSINSFLGGGWGLLNYFNKPTDRLLALSDVSKTVEKYPELFAHARPVESGISVVYTHESMWTEKRIKKMFPNYEERTYYDGSSEGGAMKSSLGYFEALADMGFQCNLKEIGEYDFTKKDYSGQTMILAHQLRLTEEHRVQLEKFVSKGGKLIIDGLTGFHEPDPFRIDQWSGPDFILGELCGGRIEEFQVVDNVFEVELSDPELVLPAHLWRAYIHVDGAEVIGTNGDKVTATRNQFGKGETVWIPSLVGLGSRLTGYEALSKFLDAELGESLKKAPVRFKEPQQGLLLKTLKSGDSYVSVLINKSNKKRNVELQTEKKMNPSVLFADKSGMVGEKNTVSISPEETVVIKWD